MEVDEKEESPSRANALKETTPKGAAADPKETAQANIRVQLDEQSENLLQSSTTPATTTTTKAVTSSV